MSTRNSTVDQIMPVLVGNTPSLEEVQPSPVQPTQPSNAVKIQKTHVSPNAEDGHGVTDQALRTRAT